MRRTLLSTIVLTAWLLGANAAHADTLWYNGDFDGVDGLSNEQNTFVSDSLVFDNFLVGGSGWFIDSLWSNNLTNITSTSAYWEIRSGVSSGDGGVLVASGTSTATQTATGSSGFGFDEYQFLVSGLNIFLAPGEYWLALAPIDDGSGRSFLSTTSNTNSVGTLLPGESYFDSPFFGAVYDPASNWTGATYEYSLGIGGRIAQAPEPLSLTLLGLGIAGTAVRRLRRRTP